MALGKTLAGEHAEAVLLLGAADARGEEAPAIAATRDEAERRERLEAALAAALSPAELARAPDAGRALDRDEAVARAVAS